MSTHPRDKVSKREYGRRPYIENYKTPYRDVQKRVPNKAIFDIKLEKMSEFIKPYLMPDYQAMEHYYPPPNTKFSMYDWNTWEDISTGWGGVYPQPFSLPEFSGPIPELYEEGWVGWYIYGCILDCFWAPSIIQTEEECDQGEYCCTFNPAFSKIVKAEFLEVDGKGAFRVTSFNQKKVCFEFTGEATTTTYPVTLRAYYRHQHGKTIRTGYCEDSIWPRCVVCDCDTVTPITIDDDNTPDTIDSGGSISVYILNGCPPFSWSVAGTGYSFTNATTEGRVNTLNCAAGTCDTQYDPFAIMTITDDCGVTATSDVGNDTIRNTGGQWVWKTDTVCGLSGVGVPINPPTNTVFELIEGSKKQQQSTTYQGCGFVTTGEPCGTSVGDCYENNLAALLAANHPNCIDSETVRWPYACDYTPTWLSYGLYAAAFESLNYYEWECY